MATRTSRIGLLVALCLPILFGVSLSPDLPTDTSGAGSVQAQQLYRLPDGRVVRLRPGQRIRRVRRRPQRPAPQKKSGFGGFLQNLFGGPSKPNTSSGVQYRPAPGPEYLNRYVQPNFNQSFGIATPPPAQTPARIPGYRTMCVRLCDGYYFPISFSTTRSNFGRDETICRSRCNTDVALFYMRPHSTDAKSMVDRKGRRYTRLKNAFAYRKSYKPQCQCKPDPWTDAAKRKHRYWAKAEAARKARADRRAKRKAEAGTLDNASIIIAPASARIATSHNAQTAIKPSEKINDADLQADAIQPDISADQDLTPGTVKSLVPISSSELSDRAPLRSRRETVAPLRDSRRPSPRKSKAKKKFVRPSWSLNSVDG